MTKYEGQTLTHKTLIIEDCFFVTCVLRECELFYSGGDFEWIETKFENCKLHFRGPALKAVQFAQIMGMLKGPEIPPMMAQPTTAGKMN